MAITKILPVRGQLKGCLDYAANPQKTEYFSTADIPRLIGYTQNKDKTEHQLYVSGLQLYAAKCLLHYAGNETTMGQAFERWQCGLSHYSKF